MRVLVTRPAVQAQDWVRQLASRGVDAAALPLIAIEPPPDSPAVQTAWNTLGTRRLVIFVSPNAAAGFFALRPTGAEWPASLPAAAPGPGTAASLHALGLPAAMLLQPPADSANFDSESLWPVLDAAGPWAGASVLIVRGSVEGQAGEAGRGRGWLAQRLTDAGATVDFMVAYRRAAPRFTDAEQALWSAAQAAPAQHLWLLSSSEAVERLEILAPGGWGTARALVTHPRIATRAQRAGFGTVWQAAPTLDSVTSAIQAAMPPSIESGPT